MSNLMEMEVYNAAVNGDLTIFSMKNHEKLLKKTFQKNNIIHVAAQHKKLDFIKAALNNFPATPICESLICDRNNHGNTPLHIAAEIGDEAVIIRLYEFFSTQCGVTDGSNRVFPWRVVNEDGNTPAHVALLFGSVSVAMYLVDKDGYVARVTNHSKETLLHLAVQNHVYDNNEAQILETQAPSSSIKVNQSSVDLCSIIERLLKIESSITCWADVNGSTPLHRAASLEPAYCIQVIKLMLTSCPEAAEVHDEKSGQTVLHLLTNHQVSSYEQGLELLKIPQVYGVRNSRNHQGETPLHLAAINRDTIMVRVLLDSSPNLGLKNKSGVSAGSLARQFEEVRITENQKKHTRKLTEEQCEAAKQGNVAFLMEQLDSLGMNFLASQAPMGRNILHILLQSDSIEDLIDEAEKFIGQAIQRLPSLISQQDCNGDTPIHLIVYSKASLDLLELICKYFVKGPEEVGGDSRGGLHLPPWRLKNAKGNTPLHVAIIDSNIKFAIKLLDLDVEVAGYVNNHNQTPLHLLSLDKGSYYAEDLDKLVSSLINGNADLPYLRDEDGLTPLLIAIREHSTPMIQRLCNRFPDCLEITDVKGRCLWHLFVSRRLSRDFLSSGDYDDILIEASKLFIRQDVNNDSPIRRLISSADNDGNTPLHLAITNQHFEFAQFFLDNSEVHATSTTYHTLLSKQNKAGVSSYNLIGSAEYIPRKLEKSLFMKGNLLLGHRSLYGVPSTKIEAYANTIGVVAALLATITFTAAFTVPGGLDSSNGTPLLLQKAVFQVFLMADVVAMCSSMMVLFCLLWIMTAGDKGESIYLLDVGVFLLQTSFHATIVTFMTGLYVTTISIVPAIAIATCVTCSVLIGLMHKRLVMLTIVPFCKTMIILGRVLRHLPSMWSYIKE